MGRAGRGWLVVATVAVVLAAGTLTGTAVAAPRKAPPPPKVLTDLLALLFPGKKPPAARQAPSTSFLAADAAGGNVALFNAPNLRSPSGRTLSNPTSERLPLVFLVKEIRGEWLHVFVSSRPNGSTAWIQRRDVTLRSVPHHILVEQRAHRLTVYRGGQALLQLPVAVGAPESPTPNGVFYVDGVVRLADTSGVYGSGQLSVSGFSEVHQRFAGGIGQIAIHGTNRPQLIGGNVSNGCLWVRNAEWYQVADLTPTGTPVRIVP